MTARLFLILILTTVLKDRFNAELKSFDNKFQMVAPGIQLKAALLYSERCTAVSKIMGRHSLAKYVLYIGTTNLVYDLVDFYCHNMRSNGSELGPDFL